MNSKEDSLKGVAYWLMDEPYCFLSLDPKDDAVNFLQSLDPNYFVYLADVNEPLLELPSKRHHAAANLRYGVYQAIEMMFSLIGAVVQAPFCPHIWINMCDTWSLRALLKGVSGGDQSRISISHPLIKEKFTWFEIAKAIHAREEWLGEGGRLEEFAKFWNYLAAVICHPANVQELNSLKHGFRVGLGGFALSFGPPVAPADMEKNEWSVITEGLHGSNFFEIKASSGKNVVTAGKALKNSNRGVICNRTLLLWDAAKLAPMLKLIAISISNIISHLKWVNGMHADPLGYPGPFSMMDYIGSLNKAELKFNGPVMGEFDLKQDEIRKNFRSNSPYFEFFPEDEKPVDC